MTFDRRRSELGLAACAASIYLVTAMKTKLQNLTHTTFVRAAPRTGTFRRIGQFVMSMEQ
jgi:hypothetical protein